MPCRQLLRPDSRHWPWSSTRGCFGDEIKDNGGEEVANCIVPGCARVGKNKLGVRLRKPDTSAIWSPETDALVCDAHARSGTRLLILFEATTTGRVEIRTHGVTDATVKRMPITH